MTAPAATRRERLRAQTLAEIHYHAYDQIARGGATALSVNGIAKAIGMSGPAMYRYVDSRDALLAVLISETYEDLARTLAEALSGARRRTPDGRLRVVLNAYRTWARDEPHRYRLIFESVYASGAIDPERIVPASQQAMDVFLDALADVGTPGTEAIPRALDRDLRRWGATTSHPDASPSLLLLAQQSWTRLHGIVSLEIEGVFAQMGIDPDDLVTREIEQIVSRAHGHPASIEPKGRV